MVKLFEATFQEIFFQSHHDLTPEVFFPEFDINVLFKCCHFDIHYSMLLVHLDILDGTLLVLAYALLFDLLLFSYPFFPFPAFPFPLLLGVPWPLAHVVVSLFCVTSLIPVGP